MATTKEKIIGTILGASLGSLISSNQNSTEGKPQEEKTNYWKTIKGAFLGGLSGYGIASIFGSPNDTVNYTHYLKNKRVYEGITYADRFSKRMKEHKANGKLFTRVVKDEPKPRVEALALEREQIMKFKPVNNIKFNE